MTAHTELLHHLQRAFHDTPDSAGLIPEVVRIASAYHLKPVLAHEDGRFVALDCKTGTHYEFTPNELLEYTDVEVVDGVAFGEPIPDRFLGLVGWHPIDRHWRRHVEHDTLHEIDRDLGPYRKLAEAGL